MLQNQRAQEEYGRLTTSLLEWIYQKVKELKSRNFPNNLDGMQREMSKFKSYRTVEKPPK